MNSPFFYFSPFEQFVITPVIPANLFILGQQLNIMSLPAIDFTISNIKWTYDRLSLLLKYLSQNCMSLF